jgi:hypothetical protein
VKSGLRKIPERVRAYLDDASPTEKAEVVIAIIAYTRIHQRIAKERRTPDPLPSQSNPQNNGETSNEDVEKHCFSNTCCFHLHALHTDVHAAERSGGV